MNQAGGNQNGEDRRTGHLQVLRGQKNLASFHTVGHDAADQGEQEDGDAAQELIQREQERRVAEAVDEPALRHDLHPGADAGSAGTNPHEAEITIMKCLEYLAKGRGLHVLRVRLSRAFYLRISGSKCGQAGYCRNR